MTDSLNLPANLLSTNLPTNSPTRKSFQIIAAVTKNWGLGHQGQLPWRSFKEDMRWFRYSTKGQTVIMGRKTWESLGKEPLPGRQNIVLTSRWQEEMSQYQGGEEKVGEDEIGESRTSLIFCGDFESALRAASQVRETWIIGGAGVYAEALQHPLCREVILTHVDLRVPTDVSFPALTADSYHLAEVIKQGEVSDLRLHPVTNKEEGKEEKEEKEEKEGKEGKEGKEEKEVAPPTRWEIIRYVRRPERVLAGPTCYPLIQGEAGYLSVLQNIIDFGQDRPDRTGVGTRSLFGINFRYDLQAGFPLLTTKRMFWKGVVEELLWFLRGQTDSKILEAKGVNIWKGNTSREYLDSIGLQQRREGDGGPIYGFNLRHWGADYVDCDTDYSGQGFDQIQYVIDLIKNNPTSRRILFTMWNPGVFQEICLPSCHIIYQFYVSEEKYLSCSMYQRSGDMGLGVPFNIASASLLTHLLAQVTGLEAKELVHTVGDCHIYLNHLEPLKRQIARQPRPFPQLKIIDRKQQDVRDFELSDLVIEGYWPYPGIKMEMAV